MSEIRCNYCRKYYKLIKGTRMCCDCAKQMKSVADVMTKKYGAGLKRLSER